MQLTIWLVPAGTVDRLGFSQPAYLEIDNKLLSQPADDTALQVRPGLSVNTTAKVACTLQCMN